ncbi:MAG: DUF3352 domain-containing protein [Planctomycetaceae bacterium]
MPLLKFKRILLSGVSLFAVLITPLVFAEDAEAPSSDQLLPPGVLLHVKFSDVSDLRERLPKTSLGKLYQDESMAKIRDEVQKGFDKASEEANKELGFPLSDLLDLPSGEASFAIVQPAGRDLAGIALMDIGDKKETLDKALAKLDEALTSKGGAKKKTETVEDVEVTVYEFAKEGDSESEDAAKKTFCYFINDGVFVGGSDYALLEEILGRWDGESEDVLAEQEVYSYIREKTSTRSEDESAAIEWYVDPIGLVTAALNSNEDTAMQALMVSSYLPIVGLDKFKGVGGSLDLAEDGYDMHTKTLTYVEQPTSGVLRAFEFPATDLTPPAWVGADAPAYSAMNWDASGAYTALTEMTDTLRSKPGFAEQQIAAMSKELGFHLKDDLIDLLDGQIIILSGVKEGTEPVSQRMLLALKIKDSAKFQETLNTLLAKAGSAVTERDFEGNKVYDISAPDPNMSPALTLAKDNLFISSHADLIESALRTSREETLADSKKFKDMKKLFPAKNSMLSYSDLAKNLKPVYDMLKSGKLDGVTEGKFDSSMIPEFEKISKYLSVSGTYTIPDEKGVYTEGFLLGTDE